MNTKSGFVQILAIVIVFVLIVLFFGKNPSLIWSEYVKPIFEYSWNLFMQLVEFLISLVTRAWQESR